MARTNPHRSNRSPTIFDSAAIPATLLTLSILSAPIGAGVALLLSSLGVSAIATAQVAFATGALAPMLLLTRFGRIY